MAFLSPPVLKLMRASLHESHDAPSHPTRQGRSQTLRLVTRCSRVSFADVGTEPRDGQYAIPHHTTHHIVSPRSASSDSARELQLEQTIRAEADRRVRARGRERDGTRHRVLGTSRTPDDERRIRGLQPAARVLIPMIHTVARMRICQTASRHSTSNASCVVRSAPPSYSL
ncbi:hypothetical protein OH76DRAFT_1413163 [Lentinus brumalis]|uniref:Uncharacterized protein n=1 Tax=Lentinus brumalis TaxID=2498619 RepID=A0A371CIL7_9APHY|nr:hypothetical protein OH76DRAFT_1413163 [Polyporus brumalis]